MSSHFGPCSVLGRRAVEKFTGLPGLLVAAGEFTGLLVLAGEFTALPGLLVAAGELHLSVGEPSVSADEPSVSAGEPSVSAGEPQVLDGESRVSAWARELTTFNDK